MKKVRLFVLKGTTKSFIDVPYGSQDEAQADIEISGGTVYHATVIGATPKRRKARLRKSLY
jgi:hypothetical protein